jgi:hypothetical protein
MDDDKQNNVMMQPFRPSKNRPIKKGMSGRTVILSSDEKKSGRNLTIEQAKFESVPSAFPLRNPNHTIALLNICHQGHRPRHACPGFRILGFFSNDASLRSHVRRYYPESASTVFATTTHQLLCICKNSIAQRKRGYNKHQIDRLVKIYTSAAEERNRDFKQNVAKARTGKVGKSMYKAKLKCMEKLEQHQEQYDKKHKDSPLLKISHTLSVAAQLSSQKYAVIIVLSDIRKSVQKGHQLPEPCIAVLDCFGTEEDALKYAKHTASKQYPKTDIDVVEMYVWHFPENVHPDKVRSIYGHEKLNNVMTARKENMELAVEFEKWCDENNVKPTVTEVEPEEKKLLE